jgi:hypothetical protein
MGIKPEYACDFTVRAILDAPANVIRATNGKTGRLRHDLDGMSWAQKLCRQGAGQTMGQVVDG